MRGGDRLRSGGRASGAGPRTALLLLGILVVALVARLCGVRYGLPYIYTTDEIFEVKRALQLGAGHFDMGRAFKGGLFYILFVEYGVYYVILRLTDIVRSSADFLQRFFADPTPFWLMGRVTSAAIGTATVYLIYRLGRKLYASSSAGVIAASFVALSVDHVNICHYIAVDVLMLTFLVLCLINIIEVERSGSLRSYLLTGGLAALATMTKLPGILVILPALIVHAGRVRREGGRDLRSIADRRLLLASIVFLVVTAAGNPGFFHAIWHFAASCLVRLDGRVVESAEPYTLRTANIWVFYPMMMIRSLGMPVFALAIVGLAKGIRRKRSVEIGLACFAVVFYILLCLPQSEDLVYSRYSLPIQMVFAISAGGILADLGSSRRIGARVRRFFWIVPLFCLAFVIPGTLQRISAMTRIDSRTVAKDWIEQNIDSGARIAIEGMGYMASQTTVPLINRRENVEHLIEEYRERDRRWQASSGYAHRKDRFHLAYLSAMEGRKTYDLMLYGSESFPYKPLEHYLSGGVDYLIIRREQAENFRRPLDAKRFPDVARFYSDLERDPRIEMIKSIPPNGSLGPTIDIYRVRRSAEPRSPTENESGASAHTHDLLGH